MIKLTLDETCLVKQANPEQPNVDDLKSSLISSKLIRRVAEIVYISPSGKKIVLKKRS